MLQLDKRELSILMDAIRTSTENFQKVIKGESPMGELKPFFKEAYTNGLTSLERLHNKLHDEFHSQNPQIIEGTFRVVGRVEMVAE